MWRLCVKGFNLVLAIMMTVPCCCAWRRSSAVFHSAVTFNQDLGRTWDVSSVTNMGSMFAGSSATDVRVCGASWKNNTAAQAEVAASRMTFDSCTCEWRHSGILRDCNIYDAVALWFSDEGLAVEFYGPISSWDTVRVTSLEHLFCGSPSSCGAAGTLGFPLFSFTRQCANFAHLLKKNRTNTRFCLPRPSSSQSCKFTLTAPPSPFSQDTPAVRIAST